MATTLAGGASSIHATAAALFLAVAAATACWLGLNLVFPDLNPSGIPSIIVRLVIHTAVLAGLWVALSRTAFDRRQRVLIWLALAFPFTAWLVIIWTLAVTGTLVQVPGGLPKIPIAIVLPVIVGLVLLLRSKRVAALLDATPPAWLIALQVYRVFGGIFLVGWMRGSLSSVFALPAGIGDVLVGLLALPVAYYVAVGAQLGRPLAYAWNVLGLIDFAIAIGIGFLTTAQIIPVDRPNVQLGTFPTIMIPAFAVPSSIIFHVLSLWQLARLGPARFPQGAPLPAT
jgi:hypothetical protein